ncbi:hypothetical protein [Nocardia sp. X0981]
MTTSRVSLAFLAFCAVFAVTACGNNGGNDPEPVPSPTSAAPTTPAPRTPTEDPTADPGQIFTPDPTLVGAHPIPFTSWTRAGENRIAIHFESGVPECYGVDTTVTETDSTVTIELRSGTRADATDKMCVMVAVFGTLEVTLEAPLGDRQVLSAV